ncbi:hypothetical protein AVEN_6764-1 [Araneus ventricosus]|uniref:Uncharacterized protein n=1 Tax=Araneus ventricosus TaxID=182803 RepID=A0A4Y2GVJ5_ARAVE|nr:hypothetical protein AVEN_6764-1 [Araneus ventricosus]
MSKKGIDCATGCHRRLCDRLAPNVISLHTIEEWCGKVRGKDSTFEDAPRSGRPIVVNDHDLPKHFKKNNSVTSRYLGSPFKVHHTTILHSLKSIEEKQFSFIRTLSDSTQILLPSGRYIR